MIRLDALPRLSARHSRAARVFRVLAGVLIGLFAAEGVFRLYLSLRNNAVEAESFEIFAVGGSTTLGQPYEDKISFPKITRFLLGERVGSRAIVVHNLAEKGHRIASQRALFDLRVAHRNRNRPGAVLIYSGHNDAVVYSDPGLHKVRAYTLLDETLTRTSLLFLQMASYWRDRGFLTAPAEPEDAVPTREEMFHAYEFNLRRVIESARERGLYPILSTVIGNVADFDPGLPPETDPAVLDAIRKGLAMESEGRYGEALRRYRRIFSETSPPADNYARYRIAKCLEALGRREEARLAYWAVVESGGDFHRATRLQNDLIRRLAAEYRVPLVDAVGAFEGTSPGKIPGEELFIDMYHPNLEGYELLGRLFAEKLSETIGGDRSGGIPGEGAIRDFFKIDDSFLADVHVAAARIHAGTAIGHALPAERLERAGHHLATARRLDPTHGEAHRLAGVLNALRASPGRLRSEWAQLLPANE